MPAVQTSYSERMSAARAGMIANTESTNRISRTVEDVAGIGFGQPVERGALDGGCVIAAGGAVLGITVRQYSHDARYPDMFPQYESAQVLIQGTIWVEASVAVAQGDPVRVDAGAFTNVGGVAIANAQYDTSAGIGELAVVRLG